MRPEHDISQATSLARFMGIFARQVDIKSAAKALIFILAGAGAALYPWDGLDLAQRISLGIFITAAGFWITEVVPSYATALMVIILQIYLLGKPDGPLNLEARGIDTSYQIFLNPLASPVIILFFGGFILAVAAKKYGLDLMLARIFLKPFIKTPSHLLLGVILITGLFSMFMSNTATALMMISILMPFHQQLAAADPFKKAIILAVAFAANIGGMGTIIGTPPNAVAASVLTEMGFNITFLKWMTFGMPLAIALLFILWMLLRFLFPARATSIALPNLERSEASKERTTVLLVFAITILLWMTEPLHHMPAPVVSLFPILIFTTFGLITAPDLKKIEWDVLFLVAGGLSLGVGMQKTGLSTLLIELMPFGALGPVMILVLIGIVTITISNFMSNTSAANIMIPMVTAIAVIDPFWAALTVAFCASLSMSLPISTPPNAIVYATHEIDNQDLMKTGTLVSLACTAITLVTLIILSRMLATIEL